MNISLFFRSNLRLVFGLLLVIPSIALTDALTADEILTKIDLNYAVNSKVALTAITIHHQRQSRTLHAKTWGQGRDKVLTHYLAPKRDKGTKMLKLDNQLWIYSPMSDRIIKIAAHMLRQSLMGSDLSYEDYMEDEHLTDRYSARIIAEEIINERACYILELTAKKIGIAYHSRKIWVDKERFLALKEERYAKSGRLLKTTSIVEVMQIGKRWYPKHAWFKDTLKKGKGTELIIQSIKFNNPIPEHMFSKAALRK